MDRCKSTHLLKREGYIRPSPHTITYSFAYIQARTAQTTVHQYKHTYLMPYYTERAYASVLSNLSFGYLCQIFKPIEMQKDIQLTIIIVPYISTGNSLNRIPAVVRLSCHATYQ